jgi:hypothetical protein
LLAGCEAGELTISIRGRIEVAELGSSDGGVSDSRAEPSADGDALRGVMVGEICFWLAVLPRSTAAKWLDAKGYVAKEAWRVGEDRNCVEREWDGAGASAVAVTAVLMQTEPGLLEICPSLFRWSPRKPRKTAGKRSMDYPYPAHLEPAAASALSRKNTRIDAFVGVEYRPNVRAAAESILFREKGDAI